MALVLESLLLLLLNKIKELLQPAGSIVRLC